MLYPKEQIAQAHDTKAELTRYYGSHTLAFSGLAEQNVHFLAPGEEGLVNYRRESNVAVALGDPVCAPQAFERVTLNFIEFCLLRNWRVAFYQANTDYLASYRALKLHAFKIGEEAILDPQAFTLDGPARANVRISARRAERDNVSISLHEGVPSEEGIHQLEQISNAWLEHKAGKPMSEMGFSTGRLSELSEAAQRADTLASLLLNGAHGVGPRVVTEIATTGSGEPCAFVTFLPVYGSLAAGATPTGGQSGVEGWGWTLDLMRRTPDAPPGVIELLLVRAIERFKSCGAHMVSLGLAAMADTRQEMTPGQGRLAGFVTDRLHLLESRRSLFNFKQKFHPRWESRYVVASSSLALPKIALAILRLRSYSGGGMVRLMK